MGLRKLAGDTMITRLKLKPGQKGTKALVQEYGDALVCVRYRYDEATRTRLKTVELIVEKKELPPHAGRVTTEGKLMPVQIAYEDTELRILAKKLGGIWDPDVKLWYFPLAQIKGTELEKHIVLDASKKRGSK